MDMSFRVVWSPNCKYLQIFVTVSDASELDSYHIVYITYTHIFPSLRERPRSINSLVCIFLYIIRSCVETKYIGEYTQRSGAAFSVKEPSELVEKLRVLFLVKTRAI